MPPVKIEKIRELSQDLGDLITSLGNADFISKLLKHIDVLVSVDHLSVFTFDQQLKPHLIVAESKGAKPLAQQAGEEYERGLYYRHDPNVNLIQEQAEGESQPLLFRFKAEDISDEKYRKRIYESFKLLERLSIIDHIKMRWFVINLYRDRKAGYFSDEDIKTIQALLSLIVSLVEKHYVMLPPSVWQNDTRPPRDMLEKLLISMGTSLSKRELEVCALALTGITNTGIGLELGIQTPTVATLRKRAFGKLGISSLNELFALCLGKSIAETI